MALPTFGLDKIPRVEMRRIPDNVVTYELPHMPPSTNNLYANIPGKGRVKTSKYRDWIYVTGLLLKKQGLARLTSRVDIVISLEDKHPLRDCDNAAKSLIDLLVTMGVLQGDRSKYVRSVKSQWAPIDGIRIDIRPFSFSETRTAA